MPAPVARFAQRRCATAVHPGGPIGDHVEQPSEQEPQPSNLVYKTDVWWTAEPPTGTRHDGPPDLAVEVRSPGTWHHAFGRRLDGYGATGTKELWLVDTPASTVLAYRVGSFDDAVEVGPGEQLTSQLLPGFTLPIDVLFAE